MIMNDVRVLLCDFHREQAWEKWVKKKENKVDDPDEVLTFLRSLAKSSNIDSFNSNFTALKKSSSWENSKLRKYIEKEWLPVKEKWSWAFRHDVKITASTNNGLECQHRILKQTYLNKKTTNSVTQTLKILLEEFLPDRYTRYVDMNKQYSSSYKKYTDKIPTFLHDRPRAVILHCMSRMDSSRCIEKSNTQACEDGNYVTAKYVINLGDETQCPSCSCTDWQMNHLPCKHMFSFMYDGEVFDWTKLSTLYTTSPFLTLDDEVFQSKSSDETQSDLETEAPSQQLSGSDNDPDSPLPEASSVRNLQVSCRESLKQLGSLTYNLLDTKSLKTLNNSLEALYCEYSTEGISRRPIPLRRRKSFKKFSRRSGIKADKMRKQHKTTYLDKTDLPNVEVDGLVMDDVDFTAECCSNEVSEEHMSDTCIDEEGDKVRQLWALPSNFNIPVAKVYGVCVTDTDIRSLKGREWLTDNIIDTYIKLLTVELEEAGAGKCLPLVSSTIGQIVNKCYHSRSPYKLSEYKLAIGAYIRASHWTLVVVDMQKETIFFYNPVEGGEETEIAAIKLSMCSFIAKCTQEKEEEVVKRWQATYLPHSSQMDSFNCGVYCLIFAEKHLHEDFDGLTRINCQHLEDMRLKIAKKMMLFEVYITDCCPKCGMKVKGQDQKLQCSTCGRCYHFKPYCVEADINSLADGDSFCCTLCRFNYWKLPSRIECPSNNYKWIDKNQALNDLCESGNVPEEEDVKIIDSQATTESPKVNKRQRDTEPRNKPKRKRTSFFYPDFIKRKKSEDELYCVCKRPYRDSECMWCCDECNQWFHPGCIGRDNKETPPGTETDFLCGSCLTEHLKDWPVENIHDIVGSHMEDEDFEEEEYFIQTEDVQRHIRKAYERCWYIQCLEGTKSSVPWMKRHIRFAKQKGLASSQGFGEALISPQAICMIKVNIRKRFQTKKDSRSIYSLHYVIPGMTNATLKTLFEEESGESENYIYKVLVKEAMVAVMQEATGEAYSNIDMELQKTEAKNISSANALIMNYMMNDRSEYIAKHKKP